MKLSFLSSVNFYAQQGFIVHKTYLNGFGALWRKRLEELKQHVSVCVSACGEEPRPFRIFKNVFVINTKTDAILMCFGC